MGRRREPIGGRRSGGSVPRSDHVPLLRQRHAQVATIFEARDRRQQVAHRVLHAADVGLGNRVAVGTQSPCEFGLRQCLAGLSLVEFTGFLDTEGALDERQAAVQLVFGEVPGQRDDFAALGPGPEQARDAKEAFVPCFTPQFAQDGQPRVAAVADDVVRFTRTAGDRRRSIETALPDRGLDLVIAGIARDAGIEVVGLELVQRYRHGRIRDGITERIGDGAAVLESVGQQLGRHVPRSQFSHRRRPPWS